MICRSRKELIDARPSQTFVSYAHADELWKKRLIDALAPLERDGFVEAWHDDLILPGENWHIEILDALADSHLVLLLVSPALLESRYAREWEIPLSVKRADSGKIRLVPVIVKSCEWTKQAFAKYQALPGDRVPIAQRSDVDEALNDCLERLKQVFTEPKGGHRADGKKAEVPLLRLVFEMKSMQMEGAGFPNWSALIDAARSIAHDGDLRTSIASAMPANRWEWMLEGSLKAFQAIEREHRMGRLSSGLAVDVISIDRTVGATYFTGTYLADEPNAPPLIDRTIPMGFPAEPPRLLGIAVRPSDPDWLMPLFTKAGNQIADEDWEREKQKLLGYFNTAVAFHDDRVTVNLSAFERGQVMPRNLAQTPFGQLMAEQDCLLKQLTASLLHPRTPEGREFWDRIDRVIIKTGFRGPIETWQRVWITAGTGTIQQKAAGEVFAHPLPPGYEIRVEDWSGWVSDCEMRVLCETDYVALEKRAAEPNAAINRDDPLHAEALDIFRETILPRLVTEVNTGSHFAPLRQAYYGVTLAKWYCEQIARPGIHTRLVEVAAQARASLGDSSEMGPGPDAPEWMNDCFERYLQLLDGVFRFIQVEPDSTGGPRQVRIYHSGRVSL